ncbi:MAG: potassium channel family protein [Pyrinomonadaceae bacterium]
MDVTENTLLTIAGLALLAMVFGDIYSTILRSSEYSGLFSNAINRNLWRLGLIITRKLSRRQRHRILASLGPLLMPIYIACLVSMLITGFALIYIPRIATEFKIVEPVYESAISQGFYFSGVTFLTIGYGDILPVSGFTRFFALIEGASGIAIISLSITYLITVYGALERRRTVALIFYHQARQGADISGFIVSHFARGNFHSLTPSLHEATRNLDEMLESHLEYSIIHFFHSREVYKGLPRIIFIVFEAVAILNSMLDEASYVEAGDHPDVLIAGDSARYVLAELLTKLNLEACANEAFEPENRTLLRHRYCFNRASRRLQKVGIKLRSDLDQAFEEYSADRNLWEKQLYHLSNFLGYDWEEVTGDRNLEDATDDEVTERHEMLTADKSDAPDKIGEAKLEKNEAEEELSENI